MLNRVANISETPRQDAMAEIRRMRYTLERMYVQLRGVCTDEELAALSAGTANLTYTLSKMSNEIWSSKL